MSSQVGCEGLDACGCWYGAIRETLLFRRGKGSAGKSAVCRLEGDRNTRLFFPNFSSPPTALIPSTSYYLRPPLLLFPCKFLLFYLFRPPVPFSFTYPDLPAYSRAVSSFSLPILLFSHSSVPSGVSSSLPCHVFLGETASSRQRSHRSPFFSLLVRR